MIVLVVPGDHFSAHYSNLVHKNWETVSHRYNSRYNNKQTKTTTNDGLLVKDGEYCCLPSTQLNSAAQDRQHTVRILLDTILRTQSSIKKYFLWYTHMALIGVTLDLFIISHVGGYSLPIHSNLSYPFV